MTASTVPPGGAGASALFTLLMFRPQPPGWLYIGDAAVVVVEDVVVSVVADAPPETLPAAPGPLTVSALYDREENQLWWESRWPARPAP
ncbi:hypothetical protein HTV45_18500 [Streptomyces sp. CHD11]|uniref:hypothetical protein n=1 Tax=Streptomyces sp. CHD11 TaxID=2741325 RepID=UPI001BFC298D|nr:hypothetical protein [Streptomyces sp. CHD11]MBT3152840.1 hypothetical protein [Streptomyces sp. CHD11]